MGRSGGKFDSFIEALANVKTPPPLMRNDQNDAGYDKLTVSDPKAELFGKKELNNFLF